MVVCSPAGTRGISTVVDEGQKEKLKPSAGNNVALTCRLILCVNGEAFMSELVFPDTLQAPDEPSDRTRRSLCNSLDEFLPTANGNVILPFDEAQLLLENDGWAFRCVRWWLTRERTQSVVAVFSGTSSKLSTFYRKKSASTDSRNPNSAEYRNGAEDKLYPAFFELTIIGVQQRYFPTDYSATEKRSEYDVAIPYGRPLFARLQSSNQLTDVRENSILLKIVLANKKFNESAHASFAILATRVQMGQVGFNLASDLVSSGYANLSLFSSENGPVVYLCYCPDPVCARLAMSLMLEGKTLLKGSGFISESPRFWTLDWLVQPGKR
jgi:hypothetical protein